LRAIGFSYHTPTANMRANKWMQIAVGCLVLCLGAGISAAAQRSYLYGLEPGKAVASVEGEKIILKNEVLTATWSTAGGRLQGVSFAGTSLASSAQLPDAPFELFLAKQQLLPPDSFRIMEPPHIEDLPVHSDAARLEEHFSGKRVVVVLENTQFKLKVIWSAILRDGDNYLRQEAVISSPNPAPIREVRLFDFNLPSARVDGVVKGSPIIAGNLFLGFEHPLSHCVVAEERVTCAIHRELPIKANQIVSYSSVIGISPPGQMRRAFLNYVERERAHPYRPFLHYNSWYDIGYGERYDQAAALDVIRAFGEELAAKRSVRIDSFLFDDGWDDPRSLWSFDSGFPDGFTPIQAAAAKYGAGPGIWLSPWGGYEEAKEQRLKYGKQQGFEMNAGGFALSGPKYFARFRQVTLDFIRKYGINQFKIDGTGNVNSVFPGSEFNSDFHAAIALMQEWREVKPDIFVNLTTGTYPSPFWLRYADSVWRGGEDHSFAGVGPWREKWITYRDADTYAGIVKKGPLFPLNSLMLHGIIYARQALHLGDDPQHRFVHEVHDYFGTGTQLQEMYITHSLLTDADWDALAEAANWSRRNAATLADTHWIGGDPAKLQVYGWASWSRQKGIITLRNPSEHTQRFSIDVGKAFELPAGMPRKFAAHSPWKADEGAPSIPLSAGETDVFELQPFEVLTLEALPAP
jgi:hypothetical protein